MAMDSFSLGLVLSYLIGGVGIFLLGMALMSDGLKTAAGNSLQTILDRTTKNTFNAFLSGVGLTALIQSSSATTVTTIGFVSAGLLSFTSAIGVIIGANVGTTSTGWIVSLLGFKLHMGTVALPLIGIGALLRLLGNGRWQHFGSALAGFGLIFVGIDFLRLGMGDLATRLDFSVFDSFSIGGRLMLVLVGTVMTMLLQSSSAAVALTLTALSTNTIGFHQAAFLVIGQNLGTTVTAALASIGASVPARRTSMAHILFNLFTGLVTILVADILIELVYLIANGDSGRSDPAEQIALFHTVFNLAGAIIFLPLVRPFSRLVTVIVPDRGPALTRHLDRSVLRVPSVAVRAVSNAQHDIAELTFREAETLLINGSLTRHSREFLNAAHAATTETLAYLGRIQNIDDSDQAFDRRLALLHAGDHLERLIETLLENDNPLRGDEVIKAAKRVNAKLQEAISFIKADKKIKKVIRKLSEASSEQADTRRNYREELLKETAAGRIMPDEAQRRLDSMFWVDRVMYHAWRAMHHLAGPTARTYRS